MSDMSEIRAYFAQQPPTIAPVEPVEPEPPTEPTWPQKRYYRAYSPEDDAAVAAIQAKYGIHAKEEAVRLALRLVAGDAVKVTTSAPVARRIIVKIKRPIS